MLRALLSIFVLFSATAQAERLTLLNIPFNDGSTFPYVVELNDKCSFQNVTKISMPVLESIEQDSSLIGKLTLLQQKINLMIDEFEIEDERITFTIKAAENLSFEFYFKKEDCKLIRVLHSGDQQFNMSGLQIDYNTFLKSPVVEKITVLNEEIAGEDLYLYPWALRGQMSLYELNVGPAVNIHSNIRVNSEKKFEKNNPIVEPIPAFFFRYGPIFLNKNGLGSLLFTYNGFSILGMGLYEGEPYKLRGLEERTENIYLGTILKYNLVELTYYRDFFKDKGYNIKLNLAPEFYYKLSWKFTPQVFIQYWDNRYVDYYFGVRPEESASSHMKPYSGTHTVNYGTMFEMMHFQERWTYVVSTGAKFYGKQVLASPTVGRDKEIRFVASIMYKFF